MATLGEIIKNYRESKDPKISMDTFSMISGLSKSYISMLERNKDPRGNPIIPTIETINKVSMAMGISFDDLFNQLDKDTLVRVNSSPSTYTRNAKCYDSGSTHFDSEIVRPVNLEYDYDYIYHPEEIKEMTRIARVINKKVKLLNLEGLNDLHKHIDLMLNSPQYKREDFSEIIKHTRF